jgi:hypothetical protein
MTLHAYADGVRLRLLLNPDREDLTGWSPVELPSGFAEGALCYRDGDFHPDPARRAKHDEIEARAAAAFQAGFTPATGPLAGHTLQVRDSEDRTNWLTSQAAYSAAVATGAGEVQAARFRTAANDTVVVTYAEGLAALLGMADWGAAIMAASWTLKDALAAAATLAEIEAVDVQAAAWPA